jgi:hypothetical protein
MNEYSMALTAIMVAVSGLGAVCGNFLVRRKRAFLQVARNRERRVDLAKMIVREGVEEMLVVTPGPRTANLSNTIEMPAGYFSRRVLSPFGDW